MRKRFSIVLLAAMMTSPMVLAASGGEATGRVAKAATAGGAYEFEAQGVKCHIVFYDDGIVRVMRYPASMAKAPEKKSYPVIMQPKHMQVSRMAEGGTMVLRTKCITVRADRTTGNLTFESADGKRLLTEKSSAMKLITEGMDKGKYEVSQTWTLDKDEPLYGLGQLREPQMSHRGESLTLWNTNTHTYMPYFTTAKGYGVFWDNPGRTFFSDKAEGTTFRSEVGALADYYFFYTDGTQDGVISQIRELTGQATMFPLWTMGHWQCRERYKTSDELAEVLDKYRQLNIPLDGIVQDWQYWGCDSNWNAMRFMNPYYINKVGDKAWSKYLPGDMRNLTPKQPRLKSPEDMVSYVHRNKAHLMISIWANFGPWTEQYAELKKMGALLPFDTWPRNQGVLPYDVFNPQARDVYWKHLTNLYRMGFDAWWTDSSEPDHFERPGDDAYMTYDGSWRSVKNAFSLMHNRGIYEHQRQMKGNSKRSVQMTRSGYFGEQHYGTFSWSGDIEATWSEFKQQIPSGLNFSLCGIPFWNTDLGGFFYWGFDQSNLKDPAMLELQTRWMQWGTFMPLMRNHCSSPMESEIYKYGSKGDWAYDAITDFIRLRYRLLPYIYSTAGDCVQKSGTMMRALVMDFAKDKKARELNSEYMFGRQLLVKPVTDALYTYQSPDKRGHQIYPDLKQAAAPVNVYLPKGAKWYDFWTNESLDGGRDVQKLCPINVMPVYVKAGSVMPFGPEVQYSTEKPWDDLEIRIYPGADGEFTLYEDEGDGYDYERGAFSEIRFTWDDHSRTLTIHDRKGKYKGMIGKRQFRLVLVGANSGSGDKPMQGAIAVKYDGHKLTHTF